MYMIQITESSQHIQLQSGGGKWPIGSLKIIACNHAFRNWGVELEWISAIMYLLHRSKAQVSASICYSNTFGTNDSASNALILGNSASLLVTGDTLNKSNPEFLKQVRAPLEVGKGIARDRARVTRSSTWKSNRVGMHMGTVVKATIGILIHFCMGRITGWV